MKKIWKKCVTMFTALALTLGVGMLAGCNDAVTAYEIAKQHGFSGTEEEWLASLKGATGEDGKDFSVYQMYEEYQADGYTGSFIDFLKELGVSFDLHEDNDTQAVSRNTSSVVSICCGFQKTAKRTSIGGWGAIYNEEEIQVSGSEGSGVVWKYEENETVASAYIVTNYHVIYNSNYVSENNGIASHIYVYPYGAVEGFTLGDNNQDGYLDKNAQIDDTRDGIKATFVGGALDYDVAILKVENSEYLKKTEVSAVQLGSSNDVLLGEKAYVIGNSNGKGISVTGGLVSVLSENISIGSFGAAGGTLTFRVMRTDAAINGGNSGGGLFNAHGELIGITNAKTTTEGVDNMGYALPIDRVRAVVDNVLANDGKLKLARLGVLVETQSATSYFDSEGNICICEDCVITGVTNGYITSISQDENKCLKEGDVLLSGTLHGETVVFEQRYLFAEQLLLVRKGDTITYKVRRAGEEIDVSLTFDDDKYFVTIE